MDTQFLESEGSGSFLDDIHPMMNMNHENGSSKSDIGTSIRLGPLEAGDEELLGGLMMDFFPLESTAATHKLPSFVEQVNNGASSTLSPSTAPTSPIDNHHQQEQQEGISFDIMKKTENDVQKQANYSLGPRGRGTRKAKLAARNSLKKVVENELSVADQGEDSSSSSSRVPGSDLLGAVAPVEFSKVGQGLTRKGGVVPVGFKPITPAEDLYVDESVVTKMSPAEVSKLKRDLRLARNRISATNSRNRKKVLAAEMENRLKAADDHIAKLTGKLSELSEENLRLKSQVSSLSAQLSTSTTSISALDAVEGATTNNINDLSLIPTLPSSFASNDVSSQDNNWTMDTWMVLLPTLLLAMWGEIWEKEFWFLFKGDSKTRANACFFVCLTPHGCMMISERGCFLLGAMMIMMAGNGMFVVLIGFG